MFPSEMVILMAIAVNKDTGKELLTRPMDITGEYIGYLYDSLANRDYLRRDRLRGYRLTSKGEESLLEFLHSKETMARDTIKRLQRLKIEIGQKAEREINKLEKKVTRIS